MSKWIGLLAVVTLLCVGCQRDNANQVPGNVAVIDMDQIAVATGFDKALNQQMGRLNQKITEHLQSVQHQMRAQLKAKRKEIGKTPTNKQKIAFNDLSNKLDQQYRTELNKAQQKTNQMHATLVGQFRQKVEPIVQTVARENGFDIVMSRNEYIVMVAPRADITQNVLKWLKKTPPGSSTPGSSTPGSSTPGSSTPGSSTPGSSVPGSSVPGSSAPGGVPGAQSQGKSPRPQRMAQPAATTKPAESDQAPPKTGGDKSSTLPVPDKLPVE